MKKDDRFNLDKFLDYYHELHDSYITNINYDINELRMEILIDVCLFGKPILNDDNTYQTNKTKIKMIFSKKKYCNINEIFSWDYIDKVFIRYVEIDNVEYLCFATHDKEPLLYIVCNSIHYEEY